MSGITRHPRLPRQRAQARPSRLGTLLALLAVTLGVIVAVSLAEPAHGRTPRTVVAAGDSITQGVGAPAGQSWPDWLRSSSGDTISVSNVGHGGSCLVFTGCGYGPTLLQTFDSEVLAQRPAATIVAPGRNDLCHVSTDVLIDAILRLRGRARAAGVTFYVGTITPAGAGWPWPCEQQRVEYNTRLRQMPNVIDFEAAVINQRGVLRWVYDSGDGLHLNSAGYQQLGATAWAAIR